MECTPNVIVGNSKLVHPTLPSNPRDSTQNSSVPKDHNVLNTSCHTQRHDRAPKTQAPALPYPAKPIVRQDQPSPANASTYQQKSTVSRPPPKHTYLRHIARPVLAISHTYLMPFGFTIPGVTGAVAATGSADALLPLPLPLPVFACEPPAPAAVADAAAAAAASFAWATDAAAVPDGLLLLPLPWPLPLQLLV